MNKPCERANPNKGSQSISNWVCEAHDEWTCAYIFSPLRRISVQCCLLPIHSLLCWRLIFFIKPWFPFMVESSFDFPVSWSTPVTRLAFCDDDDDDDVPNDSDEDEVKMKMAWYFCFNIPPFFDGEALLPMKLPFSSFEDLKLPCNFARKQVRPARRTSFGEGLSFWFLFWLTHSFFCVFLCLFASFPWRPNW